MRFPLRMLVVLLAGAVLSAAATPCPPNPEAHLTSATGEAADLEMRAKCPCSCSEGGAARLASTHLDFAAQRESPDAPLSVSWVRLWQADARTPLPPLQPLDAVPI